MESLDEVFKQLLRAYSKPKAIFDCRKWTLLAMGWCEGTPEKHQKLAHCCDVVAGKTGGASSKA